MYAPIKYFSYAHFTFTVYYNTQWAKNGKKVCFTIWVESNTTPAEVVYEYDVKKFFKNYSYCP